MASRHRSREWAVQLAYQANFSNSTLFDSKVLSNFWAQNPTNTEDRPFAEFLYNGMIRELPAVDRVLEEALQNWKFSRVEKVDLAILRIALFELLHSEDPEKPDAAVVINEAIEISKKFGNKDSPSFVNGILDSVAKKFPQLASASKNSKSKKS